MRKFYVWISILIDEYEPLISQNLLDLGYTISGIDKVINQDRLLGYQITHTGKAFSHLEIDLKDIIKYNQLKCHSCVAIEMANDGFTSKWWGSNIHFPPADDKCAPEPKPTKPLDSASKEIDDVVEHMNRILEDNARFRESRREALN